MTTEFEHPIFHDDGDQEAMLAAILDALPAQAGAPGGTRVPIHPRMRLAWAKELIEQRGVVVVPSLMKKVPVLVGDHPEAGWMQPTEWVSREDYEQHRATQPDPPSAEQRTTQLETQARDILRAAKPSLLDQIDALKDPEARARMAERLKPQAAEALNAVEAALDQVDRTSTKEDGNGVDG